ncbi:MATE family efflux transporter [Aliikangiella sp. G2MR2-5]|uniref:MATE family efflux transporter n=1 Tax=Aliikangiella sp. G2MR2-5 TaxID=2788943 RepID=UPI0018A8E14A|nr:MATE family efflux transporter [Aliikangiella sp. G2MR2-5]
MKLESSSKAGAIPVPQSPRAPKQQAKKHQQTKSVCLVSGDLKTLFIKLSVPMMIGMLLNGLYSLVDAYFISSFIGDAAFAGVSSIFPLQMALIAIAICIGNGSSVLISNQFGANNLAAIKRIFNNTLVLILSISLLVLIASFNLSIESFIPVSSSNPDSDATLVHAMDYFFIIVSGYIFLLLLSLLSDYLRAISNMKGLLLIILMGALSNVVLDYLLIVVFNLGTSGAALATVIAQLSGVITGVLIVAKSSAPLRLSKIGIELNLTIVKEILVTGSPALITTLGAAMVMATVNMNIINYNSINPEVWIGAYGITVRINILLLLPLMAISNASQTIIAQNFGANNIERVQSCLRIGITTAITYLFFITLILILFSANILDTLGIGENQAKYAEKIFAIMFILLPVSGVTTVGIAYLQAVKKAPLAIALTFSQIYLLLIPLLLLIPPSLDVNQIWYAYPATQIVMASVSILILWNQNNNFRQLRT